MTILITQTDTAAFCAAAVKCSTGTSLHANAHEALCSRGGTAGSTEDSLDLGLTLQANQVAYLYDCVIPNVLKWSSGDWSIPINFSTGDMNVVLDQVWVCRQNAFCTNLATMGSLTGIGHATNSGNYTAVVNQGSAVTPNTGDRVSIVLVFDISAQHAGGTIGITPSLVITSPISIDIEVSPGSFSLSGQSTALAYGRKLGVGTGSFGLTGQAVDLVAPAGAAQIDIDPGSFGLTGQSVDLIADRKIEAGTGSFGLTGKSIDLKVDRVIDIDPGSFALTGQSTNLTKTNVLDLGTGSFALVGLGVDLESMRLINVDSGSFVLTGQSVDVLVGYSVVIDPGVFNLSGQSVDLLAPSKILDVGTGSFVLTGQSTNLTKTNVLDVGLGLFNLVGLGVDLESMRLINIDPGVFNLSGSSISLISTRILASASGVFSLTGQSVDLIAPTAGIQKVISAYHRIQHAS